MNKKIILFIFFSLFSFSVNGFISADVGGGGLVVENFFNISNINNFDQSLNTTDNVTFNNVEATGWFSGLFNWFISENSENYLDFNGSHLAFNESHLNKTIISIGDDNYVEKSGDTMTGDLTLLDSSLLFAEDHSFSLGAIGPFNSITNQSFWMYHPDAHSEGTITNAVVQCDDPTNTSTCRVIDACQIGKNNSACMRGNSQMVLPNNLAKQYPNVFVGTDNKVNMTAYSNCLIVAMTLGMPMRSSCDTLREGANSLIFGPTSIQGTIYGYDGIRIEGTSNHIMNGNHFNIINGSLHLQTPIDYTSGFFIGNKTNIFHETFSGGLGIFTNQQVDSGNWIDIPSNLCGDSPCARATGLGLGLVDMQTNYNSLNFNDTILSFTYSLQGLVGIDLFSVVINNGSGDVVLFSDSGTETTITEEIFLGVGYSNLSSINLSFICLTSPGKPSRQCFVDNPKINGTVTKNTVLNQSGFDGEICYGDGNRDLNGNCNKALKYTVSDNTLTCVGMTCENFGGSGGGSGITGSGTANTNTIWASTTSLTNGNLVDNGVIMTSSIPFSATTVNDSIGNLRTSINTHAAWNKSGTDVFLAETGDNVGIGTASPSELLDVSGNQDTIIRFSDQDTGVAAGQTIGSLQFYSADDSSSLATSERASINVLADPNNAFGAAHDMSFWTRQTGTYQEQMRIKSDGNVGIGTDSPNERLHVEDDVNGQLALRVKNPNAGSSARTRIIMQNDVGTAQLSMSNGASDLIIQNHQSNKAINFWTNNGSSNAQKMTIQGDGNVGIGTTSPTSILEIKGDQLQSSANDIITVTDSAGTVMHTLNHRGQGTWNIGGSGGSIIGTLAYDNAGGDVAIKFLNATGGSRGDLVHTASGKLEIALGTTSSQPAVDVTIDTDGDFGWGTTVPVAPVHIDKNYLDLSVDTFGILLQGNSNTQGAFTSSIGFKSNTGSGYSGVTGKVTGTDRDQMGISWFTHPSTNGGQPQVEGMVLDHDANLDVVGEIKQSGCLSGFTRTSLGCIQTAEEGTGTIAVAEEDCHDTYGGRLPTSQEWRIAVNNYILINENDDDEWTSDTASPVGTVCGEMRGASGTTIANLGFVTCTTSNAYRCFIPFGGGQ